MYLRVKGLLGEEQAGVVKFLGAILGLYIIWYVVYDLWLYPQQELDDWLSVNVAWASSVLLDVIGFDASNKGAEVLVFGKPRVIITTSCNGMMLFGIFSGFILAYPGPFKKKIWFIPVGILVIYLINIIRVAALALNHIYNKGSFEFNHHYTYALVVYSVIFLLWRFWMKKFAGSLLGKPSNFAA